MTPVSREDIDLWFYERQAAGNGHRLIAGVDEAGRGPLAGPVVAAAVILPPNCETDGIFDSKQLTSKKRDSAFDNIRSIALAVGVGVVEEREIDRINILRATHLAMRAAIYGMGTKADFFLVDGLPVRGLEFRHAGIVKGDAKSASIAAASIIAKVTRDRIMDIYDSHYPEYGFAQHKGYPTSAHMEKLTLHGICEIHRRSYGPVANLGFHPKPHEGRCPSTPLGTCPQTLLFFE